jgi:hypothetical protein
MQEDRMDRSKIIITTHKESEEMDAEYWSNASIKEKLQTVTYLRECFYGEEATTGRLQRFYQIVKRE